MDAVEVQQLVGAIDALDDSVGELKAAVEVMVVLAVARQALRLDDPSEIWDLMASWHNELTKRDWLGKGAL